MSVRVQVGSLAGKCAPLVKTIKNNNAQSGLDPTTNFSKMVLCIFVMVQVGDLIGKCAPPLARAIEKPTMSNQALDLTPNFSKLVIRSYVRVQVGNLSGKCDPLAEAIKNNNVQSGP
jgi:hypothetical protein